MNYIEQIYRRMQSRTYHTRAELRLILFKGTGREVPKDVNLRQFVARWHADQQVINNGGPKTKLWLRANGLEHN